LITHCFFFCERIILLFHTHTLKQEQQEQKNIFFIILYNGERREMLIFWFVNFFNTLVDLAYKCLQYSGRPYGYLNYFFSLNKKLLWKLNMDQSFKIENWLSQNAYDVFMNEVEIEDKFKMFEEIQAFK
jgi:hypothetical protein